MPLKKEYLLEIKVFCEIDLIVNPILKNMTLIKSFHY